MEKASVRHAREAGGDRLYGQIPCPAWEIVKVLFTTVIVALRADSLPLGCTL